MDLDMKRRLGGKRILLLLLIIACMVLVIARRSTYYEDREYYAINFMEEKYDLLTGENQEIRQTFVAKQSELKNVYMRFYIEQLVNLKGRILISVQNNSGETLATAAQSLSGLTQTELADWTKFTMQCELEKGKTYTLYIRTSGAGGDGVCCLYTSRNREFLFGNLDLNGTASNRRLETTFLYNTYCAGDIVKMELLLLIAAAVVVISGMTDVRRKIRRKITRISRGWIKGGTGKMLGRFFLILSPFAAYYMMQTFCNYDLISFFEQLFSARGFFNMLIYILICVICYLITNRAKYAAVLTMIITYISGLANYYVWEFRDCPIVAADIASLQTAADVANNYSYSMGMGAVWATVLLISFISIVISIDTYKGLNWRRRIAVLLVGCIMTTGMWGIFFHSELMKKLDISVSVWMPQRDYARTGCALSFLLTWTYYVVEKPEGYSVECAQEIAEGYISDQAGESDTKTPNVIAIMNESFADLSVDADIETTEDYMPFIHGLEDNTVKGNLYVSVLGGNTANSEFEFQTGNSLAFFPSRSVPYNSYLRDVTGSLTWTLRDQGYEGNIAIHPYFPEGWSRPIVYPLLGFTDFISQDDFRDRTYVREFISDECDYNRLIQEYEEKREETDSPFYEFSVTMQNHGGYAGTHGLVEEEIKVTDPANADDQLTQYLNLIKKSDEAFEKLIKYFEKVDEPTVIVMFGDHQPGFTDSVYDGLMGQSTDTLDIEDTAKMYQVPYVIWANYDIEEDNLDMSANYLSSYLLNLTGAKMTGYNKYLLDLMKKLPVISAICYIGDDGVVHATGEESAYSELIREYQTLQYNNMFDVDNRISDFFFLKE